MTILDRHIARSVLAGTVLVLLVLMALHAFLTLISELENLGQNSYGLPQVIAYVLLKLPQGAYEMFPMATLLGALFGLGGLAVDRELMVMRASGMPILRLAVAAMTGGLVLAVVCLLLGDLVAPRAGAMAEDLRTAARAGRATARIENEIWVRDGGRFINIHRLQGRQVASGVEVYEFGEQGRLLRAGHASRADLGARGWRLSDYVETRFTEDGTEVVREERRVWSSGVTTELVELFVVQPENLSSFGLYRYVDYLRSNGLEAGAYSAAFWRKVVAPVTVLAMVLLAVPFVFGPLRSSGMGQYMLGGVAVGLLYYLANSALITSGQVFGVSVALMAWLPTLLIATGAVWGIRRVG